MLRVRPVTFWPFFRLEASTHVSGAFEVRNIEGVDNFLLLQLNFGINTGTSAFQIVILALKALYLLMKAVDHVERHADKRERARDNKPSI